MIQELWGFKEMNIKWCTTTVLLYITIIFSRNNGH